MRERPAPHDARAADCEAMIGSATDSLALAPGSPALARKRGRRRRLPSIAWRLARVARELDNSRRALERERSAGRFPPPDLTIGRMPLWRPQTVHRWAEGGGR
jgi:hypothetical protein